MRIFLGWLMAWLCFSAGAVAHPTTGLPAVSTGSNPNRSMGGEFFSIGGVDLMTVPDGQEFIITMVRSSETGTPIGTSSTYGVSLLSDGVVVLTDHAIGPNSRTSIAQGDGTLRINPGAALRIESGIPGTDVQYYIEGHLVETGSPYRSEMGITPLDTHGVQTIFTADADRDFIVHTLAVKPYSTSLCDVYLNDGLLIGTHTDTVKYGDERPLWMGKGSLVVPAGGRLQLRTYGYKASYYLDGEYINP